MLKFHFLGSTWFVRDGDAGGAAGGDTGGGASGGPGAALLAAKGGAPDGGAGGAQNDGAPWYSALPVEQHALIQAKGWKDNAAVVESYANLEKLLGADRAGRTVVLPGDKATPEETAAFHAKIGVPESAEGYDIKPPQGMPDTFAKGAAAAFKELGIPKAAGEKLAEWYNGQQAQADAAYMQQGDADVRTLQGEWGVDFEKNMDMAGRGAKALGVGEQAMQDKIERAIGTKAMLSLFLEAGKLVAEHGGPNVGSDGSNGATFTLTKEAANSRIEELKKDTEFQSRLNSPNAKVREEAMKVWSKAFEDVAKLA